MVSGQGPDSQWFEYRPSFFGDIIRVEWDKDTMLADLPSEAANYLIKNGYARPSTAAVAALVSEPPEDASESEAAKLPLKQKEKKK